MSLSRLWTRMLAIQALTPQSSDRFPPTMAGDRVFDSRLDPHAYNETESSIPAIVVYTSDDDGELVNTASGSGLYRRTVGLVIELTIASLDTIIGEGGESQQAFVLPLTDSQLELQLDMFEQQVRWALSGYIDRPATQAFQEYVVRTWSIKSHATRDEGGNNRLASRRIMLSLEIKDDCGPTYVLAKCEAAPLDLSAFPGAPWLGDVLMAMPSDPSLKPVVDAIAGNTNSALVASILERIGMRVDAIDPEADPNLLAEQGKTKGPDGRIEVEAIWSRPK